MTYRSKFGWEGRVFGNYVVTRKAGLDRSGKNLYLECKCKCGSTRRVPASALKTGQAKSCGCLKVVPMVGKRFGAMVVESFSGTENKRRMFRCRCDCGKDAVVRGSDLRRGLQVSCGCVKRKNTVERNTKHGAVGTPAYRTWAAMRQRCSDPKNISFKWYGAKGVTICERWQDFAAFLADMGERPKGTTIDRIDAFGNYEPGNCRWATPKQQRANQRVKSV